MASSSSAEKYVENYETNGNLTPTIASAFININVCGRKFWLKKKTVLQYPNTRLGKIVYGRKRSMDENGMNEELFDYQDKVTREYYFQRDPTCFPSVMTYYTTGILHIPRNVCVELFQNEIAYWGIPFNLEDCCQGHHQQEWETIEGMRKTNLLFTEKEKQLSYDVMIDATPEKRWPKYKRLTWDLFEKAESSRAAAVVAIISSAMVIISTITLCVGTLPEFKVISENGSVMDNPHLAKVEIGCIAWFTLEYLVRIVSSPCKRKFLKSVLNSIDLLAIIPFYIGLIIETLEGDVSHNFTHVRRFVQVLRIFRIVRIFKVARHSTGLQVLGYTVRHSGAELGLLFMLLIMGMTLFSCLVFYAEENIEGTKFKSIVSAFWWAIITMTTVGYGDMYPQSIIGQIIGSMCCVSGILFIALPIPTIVSNFSAFYKEHLNKEKFSKIYDLTGKALPEELCDMQSTSSIMLASSRASLYHGNTLQVQRFSLGQIERAEHYHRRLSILNEKNSVVAPSCACAQNAIEREIV